MGGSGGGWRGQAGGGRPRTVEAEGLPPGAEKCLRLRRALAPETDLGATGSRPTKALGAWAKCEAKAARAAGRGGDALDGALREQLACQAGVMGSGSFRGRSDCAAELLALLERLREAMA